MIQFREPTQDEYNQIATALSRASLPVPDPCYLSLSIELQGRFTVVVLRYFHPTSPNPTHNYIMFTGAVRRDTHDPDDPEIGRRVALAKVCRELVKWLKKAYVSAPVEAPGLASPLSQVAAGPEPEIVTQKDSIPIGTPLTRDQLLEAYYEFKGHYSSDGLLAVQREIVRALRGPGRV